LPRKRGNKFFVAVGRLAAPTVVDVQDMRLNAALTAPRNQNVRERDRVRAAGNREAKAFDAVEKRFVKN